MLGIAIQGEVLNTAAEIKFIVIFGFLVVLTVYC